MTYLATSIDRAAAAASHSSLAGALLQDEDVRRTLREAIRRAFWHEVWPVLRHERLKVRVWILRPSVRMEALQSVFVLVFGAAVVDEEAGADV